MDDLISRQAAIDALDFEIVHMTAYCDGKNEGNPLAQYNKGLEDGKKAIEALPSAQPEQRWIPCSERLPDKSGTYICNCVESGINHVTFIKWQSRYKRWDLNGRRTFWRVTAWKPIPEPWRGGQE